MNQDEIRDRLQSAAGCELEVRTSRGGDIVIDLTPERLVAAVAALATEDGPAHLSAITSFVEGSDAILLYHFWLGLGLTLRVRCHAGSSTVPSLTPSLPAADWYEREAHDMLGICFAGHPNLAPLLLSPDWPGPPPLAGEEQAP